jgi:NTE family protein
LGHFDVLCSDLNAVKLSRAAAASSAVPVVLSPVTLTKWDESEAPPGTVEVLLKAAGTRIDAYSYEATELLNDTTARW